MALNLIAGYEVNSDKSYLPVWVTCGWGHSHVFLNIRGAQALAIGTNPRVRGKKRDETKTPGPWPRGTNISRRKLNSHVRVKSHSRLARLVL